MYAVIETGGKQYRVSNGDVIYVEKLTANEEDTVVFDKVEAFNDGKTLKVGAPYVSKITVEGKVLKNGKGKKITVPVKLFDKKCWLYKESGEYTATFIVN